MKEEGDTYQVNQAYDQAVTRSDKCAIRYLLDTVRNHSKRVLSQFDLIAICLHILKTVTDYIWIRSFKRFNMNPDFRIYFTEWLLHIESQLDIGKRFYVGRTGIFFAIPDVWKNMYPDM